MVPNGTGPYCFVSEDLDGQGAANGQLTRPARGSPLNALEDGQLLDGFTAGQRENQAHR